MSEQTQCQSCTMTIDSGDLCQYCSDESGGLIAFSEAVERFSQFVRQRNAALTAEAARQQTLQFMAQQPAWADHAELRAALAE